jgi:hypothetical protein
MPNHITNKMIITGVSDEEAQRIITALHGVQHYEAEGTDPEQDVERLFDFNKVIPMPPSLSITEGSVGELGLQALYGEEVKGMFRAFFSDEEAKKRFDELDEKSRLEAIRLGTAYRDNLLAYGCKTWYDWCVKHWGTKWNAYDTYIEHNEVNFTTAWATPFPVIKALSKKFRKATFSVSFADEDLGQNCGRYAFKSGRVVDEYFPDGGSDEALEFACEVKGYDYQEMKAENDEMEEPEGMEDTLKKLGEALDGNTE